MEGVYRFINQLADFTDAEISELIEIGKAINLNSKEYFIRKGQIPKKFGFVVNGLFRYVYISNEGKEFTKGFMPENSFISSYSAMISGSISHFFIEAIEPSKVLCFDYHNWQALRKKNPRWDKFLIKLLERGYSVKEKREREFLLLDAESRYKIFLEEYPSLEERIKQHMIASYLGVTPIALSRIRKKMKSINLG